MSPDAEYPRAIHRWQPKIGLVKRLINPPKMRRQDVQLGPVLGDGTAGNFDALIGESLYQVLVRERLGGVLLFDQFAEHLLNTGVGQTGAVLGG